MNIIDAAKRFYGITTSYEEAGYILPDGSMLDLSGRHLGLCASPSNKVMHFSFFGSNKDNFSLESLFDYFDFFYKPYPVLQFLYNAKAIRFNANTNVPLIETVDSIPTLDQLFALHKFCCDKKCLLSVVSIDGYIRKQEYMRFDTMQSVKAWFINAQQCITNEKTDQSLMLYTSIERKQTNIF